LEYLVLMNNKSIIVVGPVILDRHYFLNEFPKESNLATIYDTSTSVGGAGNLMLDLAKLDSNMIIKSISILGDDDGASLILDEFKKYDNIDMSLTTVLETTPCTHVMNSAKTKQRTFFYDAASNSDFNIKHIDFDSLHGDILQIEYIGLIGKLRDKDSEYGSACARILYEARERGMKTSIDMVSKKNDSIIAVAHSSLKYTDYCTINEFEAENISDITLKDENDNIIEENIILALDKIKELGATTWVVIHSSLFSYGLDCKTNTIYKAESLNVPKSYIKGTTGAGDAFLSGILYSITRDFDLEKALKVACTTAVCSLSAVDGTSAMKDYDEVMKLFDIYGKGCIYETLRD